jgi:uncharacterized protein YukJ
MKGTIISTNKGSKTLLKVLLSADNTSGPIGSGGYTIKREGTFKDGTIIIYFRECDCAPATIFFAFIKGKNIYGNKIAMNIMGILKTNGIFFSAKPNSALPAAIIKFLEKKLK